MHVRLSINEQGALRNQRYAFTDRYTLVSELLQNARRAKAGRVWIDYDPATRQLVVEDDGFGIPLRKSIILYRERVLALA